jgi:3-oxoacyl-[acyl-carrier protein] reductase
VDLGLYGKVALVTGATKGIGRAVVEGLLQEGAFVVAVARTAADLEALRSGREEEVATLALDVTEPGAAEKAVAFAEERMGGLDILVNNAGRAHPGPFAKLTDADWQADIDVKLFQQIRFSRAAIPAMERRGGGRIINVNAVFGKQPDKTYFATSVNRAACIALTRTLAKELGPKRILVNSVNVGFAHSGQWEGRDEAFFRSMVERWEVPLGRFGEAREVADVILFLASERASYVTGASIEVDGGMARFL